MFFVNRVIFLALLGFLSVVGYIWKRNKPEGWELHEFVYHPGTAQDAPDDPLTLSGNGMFSMACTPSPQMREPEDLERYREFIGYMSALEKMKREGVMRPEELSTERKELLMGRPGYPFYPRRRSPPHPQDAGHIGNRISDTCTDYCVVGLTPYLRVCAVKASIGCL